jgi:hypothetical protein
MNRVTVKEEPRIVEKETLRFCQVTQGSFFYRRDLTNPNSAVLGQKLDHSAILWFYEEGPEICYDAARDPDMPVSLATVHITWSKEQS